jgi:dolichyl-diphosphooligosaccharide--protein glycosyltransferase
VRLLALLPIVGIALLLRCAYAWDVVFADGYVRFGAADPWHHMRQVDYLVANFPQRLGWDPYALHPDGQRVVVAPLFDYLVATIAWIAGLGSPSVRTVEVVGALVPAVSGALLPLPVLALGRRLAGEAAGWIAAVLVAVIPGQLLMRTMLGFADHHVLETWLVAAFALALVRALDRAEESGVSFADLRGGDRGALRRTLLDGALAGLALGAYLASWVGGAVFLIVVLVWFATQVHVEHFHRRPADALALVCVPAFAVAIAVVAALPGMQLSLVGLSVSLLVALLLPACARWFHVREAPRVRLLFLTVVLAAAAAAILHLARPGFFADVLWRLSWFQAKGVQFTVGEAQPLLLVGETRTWDRAWRFFGLGLAYVPVGLAWLAVLTVRRGRSRETLLLVWTLGMVALTFGQNRFSYYSGVNVALTAGLLFGPVFRWAWREAETGVVRGALQQVVVPLACLAALLGPVVPPALVTAAVVEGPDDDWVESLLWMRDGTPEPFGDADAYTAPDLGRGRRSAYGVLCWWDYGYWITRIAHRVPIANPTQAGAGTVGHLFLAGDAQQVLRELDERRVRYVVVSSGMVLWNPIGGRLVLGQVQDIARWADRDVREFYAEYRIPTQDGGHRVLTLFHEAYYRSLIYRLGVLAGAADETRLTADVVLVDPAAEAAADGGPTPALGYRSFGTWEEAREFVASQPEGSARHVSQSALRSCVPLEELPRVRRVHRSSGELPEVHGRSVPNVQVFELLAPR